MSITLNGVSSDTFTTFSCNPRRYPTPEYRKTTIAIPGRDGEFDYAVNSFAPTIIPCDCLLTASSLANLMTELNKIAVWAYTPGKLILERDATKQWDAKVYQPFTPEYLPLTAKWVMMLEVQPYAEDVTATNEDIDAEIDYGSLVEFYPTITVTMTSGATYVSLTLASTDEAITYTDTISNADVIVFNMSTGKVTNDGSSVMDCISLDSIFFDVPPGDQTITGDSDGTYTAVCTYRKRYLYA